LLIPRTAPCLQTAKAPCPIVLASIDSTACLLPWYIAPDDQKVLLSQTIVLDIVPITLNDSLPSEGIVEELPALAHSLFLRARQQRTQENCVRYSAAIGFWAMLVSRPLTFINA
jgi:hypothetical protein